MLRLLVLQNYDYQYFQLHFTAQGEARTRRKLGVGKFGTESIKFSDVNLNQLLLRASFLACSAGR